MILPKSPGGSGATPAGALARTRYQNKKNSPAGGTKNPPRRFCPNRPRATPAGALARTRCQRQKSPDDSTRIARGLHPRVRSRAPTDKTKLPPLATRNPPRRFCPNRPAARGLHPQVRSRAPTVKTKIPQTIIPKSPWGLGASIGFINPGSLVDLLSSKSLAQQTTLRTTRNSWIGPKT